ncbi:LPXTG cell wall anchor domain-containing protein [Streptomyces sp. NPDC050211]|uniref:LPXTG cell wall anchor domain-containing protein n=1 Tax=Streptomyces sp. NPDC050211 TaxID=3154932 RepID=UPI00344665C1
MRQTLSKGLIVAVTATTSALSLYGTWAFATPGKLGTAAQSPAVLSGNTARWDTEDGLDGLNGLDEKLNNLDERLDQLRVPQPWFENGTFGYDTDTDTDTEDTSGHHSEQPSGHGSEVPSGYGSEVPSGYGREEPPGYGPEGPPSYGREEPSEKPTCECHSHHPEPTPTPTKTVTPPPHKPTTPPPSHKPTPTPSKTPPAKPHHPQMPETGAEGIIAATAAGGALLAAGTVLYRRGRAGTHR